MSPTARQLRGELEAKSIPNSIGDNESVRFIQRLGNGAFGEVWKAEYKGEFVAAKVALNPLGSDLRRSRC